MDAEESDPTEKGWEFTLRLKGHDDLSVTTVVRVKEQALDPVRHLLELRN
jgi:hypothetical protein